MFPSFSVQGWSPAFRRIIGQKTPKGGTPTPG
jgi:hypothetical protein